MSRMKNDDESPLPLSPTFTPPTPHSGSESPNLHIPEGRDGFFGYQDERTLHHVSEVELIGPLTFLMYAQKEEKKYAHRRESDVNGTRPVNSPLGMHIMTSETHSDMGSVSGSFRSSGIHDYQGKEPLAAALEELSIHKPSSGADIPGVIHGKYTHTSFAITQLTCP